MEGGLRLVKWDYQRGGNGVVCCGVRAAASGCMDTEHSIEGLKEAMCTLEDFLADYCALARALRFPKASLVG